MTTRAALTLTPLELVALAAALAAWLLAALS
jgi:hypothetical protein